MEWNADGPPSKDEYPDDTHLWITTSQGKVSIDAAAEIRFYWPNRRTIAWKPIENRPEPYEA